MNAVLLPSPGRGRTVAELLMAVAQGDGCVGLEGNPAAGRAAVLNRLAVELAELRVRCLHLRRPASGEIDLRELTVQVAGQVAPGASPEEGLELAFEALTTLGEGCSRIVLLVDDAEALLPAAIRYIELVCQRAPQLRVVLAGPPGFLDRLDWGGVVGLRRRVTRTLRLPGPSDRAVSMPLVPPTPGSLPPDLPATDPGPTLVEMARASRDNGRSLLGVSIAASLLLATWTTNWSEALTGLAGSADPTGVAVVASAAPPEPAGDDASGQAILVANQERTADVALAPLSADVAEPPGPPPAEAGLPLPPIPPIPAPAPTKAARTAPQTPRPARSGNERLVSLSAPQADWTRCREIVLMIQMGERLTSAEQKFLRDGCRAR